MTSTVLTSPRRERLCFVSFRQACKISSFFWRHGARHGSGRSRHGRPPGRQGSRPCPSPPGSTHTRESGGHGQEVAGCEGAVGHRRQRALATTHDGSLAQRRGAGTLRRGRRITARSDRVGSSRAVDGSLSTRATRRAPGRSPPGSCGSSTASTRRDSPRVPLRDAEVR